MGGLVGLYFEKGTVRNSYPKRLLHMSVKVPLQAILVVGCMACDAPGNHGNHSKFKDKCENIEMHEKPSWKFTRK